jgi:ferritin
MEMNEKLLKAFSDHSSLEAANSLAYMQAYSLLRAGGWMGFSKLCKKASQDEHDHFQNWVKHPTRYDSVVDIEPAVIPVPDTQEVVPLFEFAAELEQKTEDSMRALIDTAEEVGDAQVVEWASAKLVDQNKDSKHARDFAKYLKACSPGELVLVDRRIENGEDAF